MKYRLKMKQKAVKVKGQKRRVVEQTPRVYYSNEEIAQMADRIIRIEDGHVITKDGAENA